MKHSASCVSNLVWILLTPHNLRGVINKNTKYDRQPLNIGQATNRTHQAAANFCFNGYIQLYKMVAGTSSAAKQKPEEPIKIEHVVFAKSLYAEEARF